MAENLRQVICPCCGRAVGRYNPQTKYKGVYKDPEQTVDYLQDYLARIYDINRDYFAVEQEGGRGGLSQVTHLTPADWPEGFESAKEALLRALLHYWNKGWITNDDLNRTLVIRGAVEHVRNQR